jgi:uncharacterized protein
MIGGASVPDPRELATCEVDPMDREGIHRGHRVRPFRSTPWLPGASLQTVLGKFLRPRASPELFRERWATPDGDFVDLDFGSRPRGGGPLVLILHGLEGSTRRGYVRLAMREVLERGMQPVGLNFRSCSGEPNRTARFYHSGETGDLAWVLERLHHRFPGRPMGAIGFSLGGNVLLRFLGERAEEARAHLAAAAAISVPFDLVRGIGRLEAGGMGRIYTRYFLRSLLRKSEAKGAILESVLDFERLRAARTLREFDDVATAPLHGFVDAGDYYRKASSAPVLRQIRIPTLLLHADDDPFLPAEAVPRTAVEANPFLMGAFPAAGGHVGFVERSPPWAPRFWAEREAARYVRRLLDDGAVSQVR